MQLSLATAVSVALIVAAAACLRRIAGRDSLLRYRVMRGTLWLLLLLPFQVGWLVCAPRSWSMLPVSWRFATPDSLQYFEFWISSRPEPTRVSLPSKPGFDRPQPSVANVGGFFPLATTAPSYAAMLAAAYWVGVGAACISIARRAASAARIVRNARPVTHPQILAEWNELLRQKERLGRASLWDSDSVAAPSCWGWRRYYVLLPVERMAGMSPGAVACILRHELQHLERRDPVVAILTSIVQAVYWCHPAAWWFAAALRRDCEAACDAAVIRTTRAPRSYALALLEFIASSRRCVRRRERTLFLTLGSRNSLERRLAMLQHAHYVAGRGQRAAIGLLFAGTTFVGASWQSSTLVGAAPPQEAPTQGAPSEEAVTQADASPGVEIMIDKREGDRITRIVIQSVEEGRSAKQVLESLQAGFQANPQGGGRFPESGSVTMQETLLAASHARQVDGALVARKFDLYLPEGSQMRAVIEGTDILVDREQQPLVVVASNGALRMMQENSKAARLTVEPEGNGTELRFEIEKSAGEVHLLVSARPTTDACVKLDLRPEAPQPEAPQPEAPQPEAASPLEAVRWSLRPERLSQAGNVELKMQWIYDLAALHRHAEAAPGGRPGVREGKN